MDDLGTVGAVSGQETGPLRLERSGVQHCRTREFDSGEIREGEREEIYFPCMNAQVFAHLTDGRISDVSSRTQMS